MIESSREIPHPAIVEEMIRALTGVVSARVMARDDGHLTEIHVLAGAEIQPKQVVRNVESALRAGLGLEIDRRIVSVAQLRPDAIAELAGLYPDVETTSGGAPPPAGPGIAGAATLGAAAIDATVGAAAHPGGSTGDAAAPAPQAAPAGAGTGPRRLIYLGHEVKITADRTATCTVTFRSGSKEYVGHGQGFDTQQGRAEAAARAVLVVLDESRAPARIGLEGVAIVEIPQRRCVLVAARPLGRHRGTTLTGAALLGDSPEEAAIMAVLQATNSWRVPS